MLKHAKKALLILVIIVLMAAPILTASAITEPPAPPARDPMLALSYTLTLDTQLVGRFTVVTGIGSSSEIVEYKASGSKGESITRKNPGKLKFNEFTLKRGLTDDMSMWDWRQKVVDGKTIEARKNGSIIMYGTNGNPIAQWNFENGWPSGVSFNADENGNPIEVVTITCEGIKRVK